MSRRGGLPGCGSGSGSTRCQKSICGAFITCSFLNQSPSGKNGMALPYQNADEDWRGLNNASRYARYLGLVDASRFVDRRNPPPLVFAVPRSLEPPSWSAEEVAEWRLPRIESDLSLSLNRTTGHWHSVKLCENTLDLGP